MPSQNYQDVESPSRFRPRSNTASFLAWRPRRPENNSPNQSTSPSSHPQPVISNPLSPQELIDALMPPAVPSLSYARALASALTTMSPLPSHDTLMPIVGTLCSPSSPVAFQAAGFDILASYIETADPTLTTSTRLAYFSLFVCSETAWHVDLWEPRFKALRLLTKDGAEVVGIEIELLSILKTWIRGAFEGLIDTAAPAEKTEISTRERSLNILSTFLTRVVEKPQFVSRIPDQEITGILHFYASLVDAAAVLSFTDAPSPQPVSPPPPPPSESPSRFGYSHRRTPSSLSTPSLIASSTEPSRRAPDVAIALYLAHLTSQLKTLRARQLGEILPVLFRALAFASGPLPRLSVTQTSARMPSTEGKISAVVMQLLQGPHSRACMRLLSAYMYPPSTAGTEEDNISTSDGGVVAEHIPSDDYPRAMQTALGAYRALRTHVRQALSSRIARTLIARESSMAYSHSGAPGHIEVQQDLLERAWPREDMLAAGPGSGWDAERLGQVLPPAIERWVEFWVEGDPTQQDLVRRGKERILEEAAGMIRDIFQELETRDASDAQLEDDEAETVGQSLLKLASYVLHLRNPDGTPFLLSKSHSTMAPNELLRNLAALLGRNPGTTLYPSLSAIQLSIADHLTDDETAQLPPEMLHQHDLYPTSPEWLSNWQNLLANAALVGPQRPRTKASVMDALLAVYDSIRDMPVYRRPFADQILEFCARWDSADVEGTPEGDDCEALWIIMGDEVVSRTVEGQSAVDDETSIERYLEVLLAIATQGDGEDADDEETVMLATAEQSPSPSFPHSTSFSTTTATPSMSRQQSDFQSPTREREVGIMSLLTSLTSGSASRSQSVQQRGTEQEESTDEPAAEAPLPRPIAIIPRVTGAVTALIRIFCQLAFTPHALVKEHLDLAVRVYKQMVDLLSHGAKSRRARICILQFVMRLRADRNHQLYFCERGFDLDGHQSALASLIERRSPPESPDECRPIFERSVSSTAPRPSRVIQRDGRRTSRAARGGSVASGSTASRSRSRVPAQAEQPTPPKPRPMLWRISDILPFTVTESDMPSEGLVCYDPSGPANQVLLPTSYYLKAILSIITGDRDWEVLSYVLCHLPAQLANKHMFCGPNSRALMSQILNAVGAQIMDDTFASGVDRWQPGLKARDAQGLVYHTLSVLISYRRCFDTQQRNALVELFMAGLDGRQPATIKCCLHALSLSAFDLQQSMAKYMTSILTKLSQIMTNPDMAVHILGFLAIVGSIPPLYANFTESDYKLVFGVALQYLQHYNREGASPTMSWALSQFVRILSYRIVYVWFLAVRLPDRRAHMPYITRQLLLANEGREAVDDATEVCFDWLARYTYATADPRPAHSLLSDIVMNAGAGTSGGEQAQQEAAVDSRTWVLGNSVITVRTLVRVGWVEVIGRRPSGLTKFLCRIENAPMVGPGDVHPDMITGPAALLMERGLPVAENPVPPVDGGASVLQRLHDDAVDDIIRRNSDGVEEPPAPDPITGYVWSKTAPSQRRKDVAILPSFFALQLSPYPTPSTIRPAYDQKQIERLFSSLDRMPVIDTHKVGIMYVAPGQTEETEILRNSHGSPAYTRFLEGLGRLIDLRGQVDVYAGGLDPGEDGDYAYAWWDDIGQILYHAATMMPNKPHDPQCNDKKRHIGNDYVRIVWNDSGMVYRFDTLSTQFQFVNIIIEPHSYGGIAAFSNNVHENEYFKVTVQRGPGMPEFAPIGDFKLISAENLPLLVRQLSLLADWFASVFKETKNDTERKEMRTNWQNRLQRIRMFKSTLGPGQEQPSPADGLMGEEQFRDFTTAF
ncbi:hypothetical protein EV715DRAFT_259758 [Schizophyllum commune]